MPKIKLKSLDVEQTALFARYREKWTELTLSTGCDRDRAEQAVRKAYKIAGLSQPKTLIWVQDPVQLAMASQQIQSGWTNRFDPEFSTYLKEIVPHGDVPVYYALRDKAIKRVNRNLKHKSSLFAHLPLVEQVWRVICERIREEFHNIYLGYPYQLDRICGGFKDAAKLCFYDFLSAAFGLNISPLEGLFEISEFCGLCLPFKTVAVICPKPERLAIEQGTLHAEGESAIDYPYSTFRIYAFRGVILPEQYGRVHPNLWQAQWLRWESDVVIYRLLLRTIGYERIVEEFPFELRDRWQDYDLIQSAIDVDFEECNLLVMLCPSTGHLHFLRVPPWIDKAREAVRWCNWDIDPTKFAIET